MRKQMVPAGPRWQREDHRKGLPFHSRNRQIPESIAFFSRRVIDEVSTALLETLSREPIDSEVNPAVIRAGIGAMMWSWGDYGCWSFGESSCDREKAVLLNGGVSFSVSLAFSAPVVICFYFAWTF